MVHGPFNSNEQQEASIKHSSLSTRITSKCVYIILGYTGPLDRPRRTSIPWCMSNGRKVSDSRGSAYNINNVEKGAEISTNNNKVPHANEPKIISNIQHRNL
jgi:hypothetical protein